jgi:hypothetical protein
MEEQIPSTNPTQQGQQPPQVTPELLEMMKARAREEAIRMTFLQQQAAMEPQREYPIAQAAVPPSSPPPPSFTRPEVVYVRRNLTVAELVLIFALACGAVTGFQAAWNFVSNSLPRIEIKAR